MLAQVSLREDLEELAGLSGVRTAYHDVTGRLQSASDDALIAVLRALGTDIREPEDVGRALVARRAALAERILPPIVVCWDGRSAISASLRAEDAGDTVALCIDLEGEGGEQRRIDLPLSQATVNRHLDRLGVERIDVSVSPDEPLPIGYHRVTLRSGTSEASARLWSAPRRAYQGEAEPGWGLFAPVYCLRSENDAGIGDFADLDRLCRWIGARGGATVATLPLLPIFIEGTYDPSPYSPVSRRFYNELFISLAWLEADRRLDEARAMRDSEAFAQMSHALRQAEHVDYRAVLAHKRRVLSVAADAVLGEPRALARFEKEHPEIASYARFRAISERQARPIPEWPERLRCGRFEQGDYDPSSYRYHFFCQLEAQRQIETVVRQAADAGVGLYLDLPLGTHSQGYDAFHGGRELVLGCSVGAPPDTLFEGGQDWGFAPPHPERSSEAGHALFVQCLRHHMRHAAVLRIDHVMGLGRLFFIPRGHPPTDGVYVEQPSHELYAALCIESVRSRTRIVGEDLGTVPPETRSAMAEHGFDRLYVLQYEPIAEPGRRGDVPAAATASINTHDMPTFFGFWSGRDIETRVVLGILDRSRIDAEKAERSALRRRVERWLESLGYLEAPCSEEALLEAQLRYLAESPARTVLVSISDITCDAAPHNVPGTGPERPNWVQRSALTLEELERAPEILERLSILTRGPPTGVRKRVEAGPRSRPCRYLSDEDIRLFGEGTHRRLADVLGAHPGRLEHRDGVHFAVWAPNARSVTVIGDFNGWDRDDAPLWPRNGSGIWEGFVPGAGPGDLYKFRITGHEGVAVHKADPMARAAEIPPRTASIIAAPTYAWGDGAWMRTRSKHNAVAAPCSVYEVHLGSFGRAPDGALLGYRELAPLLADHVADLGFSHVELMPVMEHPFYASWGYQVTGYYGATSRYGRPEDLMFLIDTLHQRGIGVLLDWVPGHFPTDEHGLGRFDGTHLYEHADPRLGFHPDWNSYIFNYGRHEVRSFLVSSALHWLREFHADGLRVDGVASMLYLDYSRPEGQWLPNAHGGRENLEAIAFLKQLNEAVHAELPDVQTVAEESTAFPMVSWPTYVGGLGFGLKWDLGWMHDTLAYFSKDPIYRRYHHDCLTFRRVYAHKESFVLPLSHDEVVHGKGSLLSKMPGDDWQRFANLRALYAYMFACPGHKLLFMGNELASWAEWNHEEALPLHLREAPMHAGIAETVRQLNRLYRTEPALYELDHERSGIEWVDVHNAEQSVLAFVRRSLAGDAILCVFNFTPVVRQGYRIGVSRSGIFRELLNTDAAELGGSGVGNLGGVESKPGEAQGRSHCIEVTLPPLGALYFKAPGPSR